MTTRRKLEDAAVAIVAGRGVSAVSARAIAAEAGVNQALIFYHFGSVDGLVEAACRASVDASIEHVRARLVTVDSLVDLLHVGRELHERERTGGNVALMAHLMAGAQTDESYAGIARYSLDSWLGELGHVVTRLLDAGPLAGLADPAGLARVVAVSFLGLELYEGVDRPGALLALDSLEELAALVDGLSGLGALGSRAVRTGVRRTRQRQRG